jgi:hypothetical protein
LPYPLPNEDERRALFAWLKQASSLTAWRRLYSLHQAFVDVVTQVYDAEQRGAAHTTIPGNWLASLLRDHDAFAGALDRLALGDRRCFTFLGARGHFSQGLTSVRWWQDMYGGAIYGRNSFGPDDSPRWTDIADAMHACLAAAADIGVVLQKRYSDVPAPIRDVRDYYASSFSSLIKRFLADPSLLPPVPLATPELLVPTGQPIPCYGVWEPVQIDTQHDMLQGLRVKRGPGAQRTLDGCMNYLFADVAAPTIGFPEDGQRKEGRATTWRLLWRDERYGDLPIPEEESHYVFVQPVPGEVLFRYS